ncbi:MAG: O-antigen ligase family protein [Actinobacteria bacterium]|nr:O-antigen ligase family protein [Actinomycetota bacterium]
MEKINKYSNYLFRLFLLLIILFISSDIFLVVEVSDATIRFSYIVFSILFILWIIYCSFLRDFSIPKDKSYLPLFLFCFVSFISSLNSIFALKSLIYSLWTIFSALTIVFLVWFLRHNKLRNLDWILKIYFYSFFAISVFGLYQVLLPFLIEERTPFVRQWWDRYTVARINGLSFEPSFFATYLLMGCFIWFILWLRNNDSVKYKSIILITISLVIVLSSSRLGWIGIVMIIAYGLYEFAGHYIVSRKFPVQHMKFFITFSIIVLVGIIAFLVVITNQETFKFLFKGTGLLGTTEFTFSMRNDRTMETFKVFLDKPSNIIIGAGPGGVGAYINRNPESFINLWSTEPNNITAEILASVGIIGFGIFVWFIAGIFKRLWALYKNNYMVKRYRTICLALFCGLAIELIILQFNQNYLRPYLWLHIGICIAAANVLENFLKNKNEMIYINSNET